MESWKLDELAREMHTKKKRDMTEEDIELYFCVSPKDASEIKKYYSSHERQWDNEEFEAEMLFWEHVEKPVIEARKKVVDHCIAEWGDDAKRKIDEIQNEIYSRWHAYGSEKRINFPIHSLFYEDFGQEKKVLVGGNFISVMHEFADRINAELYLYYKYTKIVKKHRKDKTFCVTKEELICKYLENHLQFIAGAYSFNSKELGFRYSLSSKNFKEAYRYLCFFLSQDSGSQTLRRLECKIFEMACIHMFVDKEYDSFKDYDSCLNPSEFFVEYGSLPWVEQKNEALFAMVYFYCCYKEAYATLNELVYSEKNICSKKSYDLAELEELISMTGNGYPKSIFRAI